MPLFLPFSFPKPWLQEYAFDMDVVEDDHRTHARRLAAGPMLSEITSDSAAFLFFGRGIALL